jgi:hypothetical protein
MNENEGSIEQLAAKVSLASFLVTLVGTFVGFGLLMIAGFLSAEQASLGSIGIVFLQVLLVPFALKVRLETL